MATKYGNALLRPEVQLPVQLRAPVADGILPQQRRRREAEGREPLLHFEPGREALVDLRDLIF